MRRWKPYAVVVVLAAGVGALADPGFAQQSDGFHDAFGHVGFSEPQVMELADHTTQVSVEPYRFGDDSGNPPTIDASEFPWTRPTGVGSELVTFPPDYGGPAFPPDAIVMTQGEGLMPGGTYGMLWATFAGEMTPANMNDFFVNISFPTRTPSGEAWVSQFAADTWVLFGRIPYMTYGPQPWGMALSVVSGGSLSDQPFNGLAFVGHGVAAVFVDINALTTAGDSWNDLQWGFAIHVHDGSFGSCESCLSTISAVPAIGPGGSGNRTPLTVQQVDEPLLVGSQPRVVPTTSTTTTSTTPSTTTTTLAASTAPTAATSTTTTTTTLGASAAPSTEAPTATPVGPATTTSSGDFPWFVLVLVGLGVGGAGVYIWWTNRDSAAGPTVATTTRDDSWVAVIEDDTTVSISDDVTILKERPGKGEGGTAATPPLIGRRGILP